MNILLLKIEMEIQLLYSQENRLFGWARNFCSKMCFTGPKAWSTWL